MLRLFVLALLLANATYFAWSQGLLRELGWAPALPNEPQRVAQQIRPDAVRVLSASEFKSVEALLQAEREPKVCLQAGPFDEVQTPVLRRALESTLPPGSWQLDAVPLPARWIIYMGKYPNSEMLLKKRAELAAMNLPLEALQNPALELGLSLGGFDSQDAANARLVQLNQRGIRTAHVVQERAEAVGSRLRLPAETDAFKDRVGDLRPALAGKVLSACP